MSGEQSSVKTNGYDVEAIRRDFPILDMEVYGKPLVYLDNAASAQKPKQVIERVKRAYEEEYANVHRGLHYLSSTATLAYEASRGKVRKFLNAKSDDEIVLTSGGTDAFNLIASSYGGSVIEEGDEIILSIMEHHSNIVPWDYLRTQKGAVIRWAPISDTGEFLLDEFEKLLSKKTKIVAITHMSNALGTVTPIKEIIDLAHSVGAIVVVDGCQGSVHMPVDVQALDCDFYVITGHKLYGPSGIGALYGKSSLLKKMPPYRGGGEMIREVTTDGVTYADPPNRFEAGTPPIVQAIGLGEAIDYIESVGREHIQRHEAGLLDYAMSKLGELNSLCVFGTAPGKGAIISFEVEGAHAHDISTIMDRSGVAVRAGHHCAQPLMDRLGVASTSRASFGMYNTKEEVDLLVESVLEAMEFFR